MVLGALIFLAYAVVFFFRAFSSTGFELGVETLNGVTPERLDGINPAIMAYITHLHVCRFRKIRFVHIDGVTRRGSDGRQCLRTARLRACKAHPSRGKRESVLHCNRWRIS